MLLSHHVTSDVAVRIIPTKDAISSVRTGATCKCYCDDKTNFIWTARGLDITETVLEVVRYFSVFSADSTLDLLECPTFTLAQHLATLLTR